MSPPGDLSNDYPEVDPTEWNQYRKTSTTWAVELPEDVTIPTPEGEMEAEAGDYLCIDSQGGVYPVEAEVFAETYAPVRTQVFLRRD